MIVTIKLICELNELSVAVEFLSGDSEMKPTVFLLVFELCLEKVLDELFSFEETVIIPEEEGVFGREMFVDMFDDEFSQSLLLFPHAGVGGDQKPR